MKARPGDHWARALVSEDPIRLRPAKLREVRLHSLAVRFAFGAAVSLLAGLVTVLFGPRAGGVWLAFPAILPAGLTLIERREGRREADRGVRGSVFGAIGMVAFAVTVYVMVPLAGGLAALLAALLVWLVVTLGLYLGLRASCAGAPGPGGDLVLIAAAGPAPPLVVTGASAEYVRQTGLLPGASVAEFPLARRSLAVAGGRLPTTGWPGYPGWPVRSARARNRWGASS